MTLHVFDPKLPMTWDWVAGFFDGEATFRYAYEDMRLHTFITIPQKEREVLDDVRDFVKKELDIDVGIYWDASSNVWRLMCFRFEDVYTLCHKVYPHLRHPKKIEDCLNLMLAIRRHAETMIPIERRRHRIKTAERYERVLQLARKIPIHIYA